MKIASRYLIPLELFMAAVMMSWGLAGWKASGPLWSTLQEQGLNTQWGLTLCGLSLAQISVTFFEWQVGCRLERWLMWIVYVRAWLAFLATVAWFYVFYFVLTIRGVDMFYSLALQAPLAVAFSVWAWVGNIKVALVLDPKIPTEALKRNILLERQR